MAYTSTWMGRSLNASMKSCRRTRWSSVGGSIRQLVLCDLRSSSGHFAAEEYDPNHRNYVVHPNLAIHITVDEVFDNDHRVVSQRGSSSGKFTFTAADSGDHRLCFNPIGAASSAAWLSGGAGNGGIKMRLDLAIGETSIIESADKGKIADIAQKVRDLNGRLQDIRREQIFQRVGLLSTQRLHQYLIPSAGA